MAYTGRFAGVVVIAGLFAGLGATPTLAQDLTPSLLECRAIDDDDDRLDCFDGLVRNLNENSLIASGSVSGPAAEAPPEVQLTAEERFGMEDLPEIQKEKRKEKEKTKSITASVVDIARNGRGKFVVILENGQIWRQLNADTTKLRLPSGGAEGTTVEIKRKSFGAHSLKINGDNRSIKVERIK